MSDKQCSSCGGICNPSGCERENEPEALFTVNDRGRWEETDDPNGTPLYTAQTMSVPKGWKLESVEDGYRLTAPDGERWKFRETDGADLFVFRFLAAMLAAAPEFKE